MVLRFFISLRDRAGGISMTYASAVEEQQIKLIDFMIQFLQQTLLPFEDSSQLMLRTGPLGLSSTSIIVKCFEAD